MSQSMISVVVGLGVFLVILIVLFRRYRIEHPGEGMFQWMDSHHMRWMHRRR
ncbi:hypothetical protein F4827_007102 [Paraburkholderia bannensis]|uniref:Uncharacterized protein n=1 Tax=Paraburkholderia bannensis TaxID=765414 RepID=A0A7W9WV88_9BURK|nr:hypothetical protein [Paraburkholderia sp. WP4_3_2]MBB6107220.1 hypothetical protein [Paraburkholderia bannensis]